MATATAEIFATPLWATFFSPQGEFNHICPPASHVRSMTEHERSEYVAGARPEGGSTPPQPPLNPRSGQLSSTQFNSAKLGSTQFPPWAMDLVKMGLASAFTLGITYAWMKDGIATGKRGFEMGLENKAGLDYAQSKAEADLAKATLAWTKANKNLSISLGRIMGEHVKKMVAAQAETDQRLAVLTEAQARAETASRERDERIEVELRDWQIRTRVKP